MSTADVPAPQDRCLPTPDAAVPVLIVTWDSDNAQVGGPCARYLPDMAVAGTPLNLYLAGAIDRLLAQWRTLPDGAEGTAAFLYGKQSCLQAIRLGLAAVYRPGVDAGYIAVATALCANAVRTVTLLSEAALTPAAEASAGGVREFKLSRAFAGLTRYKAGMLSASLLPFGAGRRIDEVKRQAAKDPRLLANIFACEVDAVQTAHEATIHRLRAPARALCA